MSYTNATFYLDYEGGSDSARTALTTVTAANPSGTITRMTKTAHGLVTGAVVDLSSFSAWLNAPWKITVVDTDNFDLDGAVWQTTVDNSGTATPRGGSSKTDAWKTVTSGASAAHIAAGDTIRIMASPDQTSLGQNATWTQNSKTVTLTTAVTANIADCETAWTASVNVTSTADTTLFKENTKSAKHVIASGFTTGLVSFFATGTLDLSAYQQVSFWLYNSVALAASTLSLRLCSDAAGVTTVNTIAIPAVPSATGWVAFTIDTGGALGASIKSVALYADLDPGTITIQLDNIIACKASSSNDSLTLTSLIGKVWNLNWAATTAYAANDIRKPTSPNRNGYRYKVTAGGGGSSGSSEPAWPQEIGVTVADGALTWTCEGLEDTWRGICSINGTTVILDGVANTPAGREYAGATETVAAYKREAIKQAMAASTASSMQSMTRSGTTGAPITYSGGWNRTDMTTQTGETWVTGQNGNGRMFDTATFKYITLANLGVARAYRAIYARGNLQCFMHVHAVGCNAGVEFATGIETSGNGNYAIQGMHIAGGSTTDVASSAGLYAASDTAQNLTIRALSVNGCATGIYAASAISTVLRSGKVNLVDAVINNNADYAIRNRNTSMFDVSNLTTAGNATAAVVCGLAAVSNFNNCSFSEATVFTASFGPGQDRYAYSQKHNQTANNHLITTDGGTIVSATDQRNTASGISWKFCPADTSRSIEYPLRLSLAKIACTSGVAVNLNIYTRRDSTQISGQLRVPGGQIAGVGADVIVACAPAVNTWTNSSTLTFTPTESGVVEVVFEVGDGVGATNNFWIDDLTIA